MSSRRPILRTLAAAGVAILGLTAAEAAIQPAPDPVPVACIGVPDPLPTGITQMPADQWADPTLFTNPTNSNDYHWMHSSTNLQGAEALEKWGACVFFNPDANQTAPVDMSDWRSMVVVNNPSPTLTVTAKITYRDPAGTTLNAFTVTLLPEQTFVKGAIELRQFGPGIGSVQVTADHPIVGATFHHFGKMKLSNGVTASDPDYLHPGEGMEQQLQMSQDFATVLYSGPFPVTNNAKEDFLNGNLPLNCVVNPNPTPTTLTVTNIISPGTTLNSQTVNLPAYGMFLDTSIWAAAEPFYLTNPAPFNFDILTAAASSGNPILGDFLMVDVLGNGAPANLNPNVVLRAGSGMMQNSPALRLLNGEHTETSVAGLLPQTPPVTTMMGVANVTANNIGPVTVEFFTRNGAPAIPPITIPALGPGAVWRITPNTVPPPPSPQIPQNFAGWARITACQPGLIGWTMREVQHQTQPYPVPQFHKAYGEELDGANGGEPGRGFRAVTTTGTYSRKVAPFLRAAGNNDFPNWWPSYVNGVNQASANINQYWHRFFTMPGVLAGQQTFAGLPFANTSFTFVDPIVNLINAGANVSGRFDRTTGTAMGMEAVGDPMVEWQVPMFLGSDVGTVLQQQEP